MLKQERKNSFAIYSFGCKVNTYECEGIKERLFKEGYIYDEINPSLIIVNTCAVTVTAERKCFTKVRSLSIHHKDAEIIVMGCSSQLHKEKYLEIKGVKVVLGNSEKLAFCDEKKGDNVKPNIRKETYDHNINISRFGEECRAFLKIQDGCDNFCSYCVIPLVRGNSRSRRHEDILLEARRLFNNGYHEIVITGIDMGSYQDPNDSTYLLKDLLNDLLKEVRKGNRIRISSLETSQINDEIVSLYLNNPDKLVPHLHIPLQSGSDVILKKMNRKYDLDEFKSLVEKIRSHNKAFAFSTDVIVGFPGEDEKEFEKTYKFIEDIGFMRIHVFPYSPRPFTLAATLKEQVRADVKKSRVHKLIELGERLKEKFISSLDGQEIEVLFETKKDKDGKTIYTGYSENYLEVSIVSDKDLLNKIYKVVIKKGQFYLAEDVLID